MKKFYFLVPFILFIPFFSLSQNLVIDEKEYLVDTLAHFPVGPGTEYISLRLKGNIALNVFFLKTATNNPYISFKTVLGHDSIYSGEAPSKMAARKSKEGEVYFAGTNGDFYGTNSYPISGCMRESEIAKTPRAYGNLIAFTENKLPKIGKLNYKGTLSFLNESWEINSVNYSRESDFLVLFNQYYGKTTRTNSFGTEVQIEPLADYPWGANKKIRAKVLKVEQNKGNMSIPKGLAVLSGHGEAALKLNSLSIDDEIELLLELKENDSDTAYYAQFLGGEPRPLMLKEGTVETVDVWAERHPRTGIGFSENKDTVIFCVVDGRSTLSAGVTTKQLADLMKTAGAYTALNLDGGGSSCMYVKEFGQVNKPSDGKERAVSNAVFAVSSAPTDDTVVKLIAYNKTVRLPQYAIHFPDFLAYNQYDVLLNSSQKGVKLSCDLNVGEVLDNGYFMASGAADGILHAIYKNVQTQVKVELIEASGMKFVFDSILIDNRVEFPIKAETLAEGKIFEISPMAFSWEIEDPSICSIEKGRLKGIKNGTTWVIGRLNDFKDSLFVRVQIPDGPQEIADYFVPATWTLNATSNLKAVLNTDNLPSNWNHGAVVNYVYKQGRFPDIKLSKKIQLYGRPDAVKIILNVGDIEFDKINLSLRANNAYSKPFYKNFDGVEKNVDTELVFPVDELFNSLGQGIFPISFNFLQFYLSPQIPDKAYSLALKEILLCYKGVNVGFINPKAESSVAVFPNPLNTEDLYFRCDEKLSKIDLKIYDFAGKLFRSTSLFVSDGEGSLSLKGMPKGTYLLKLFVDSKEETIKIIKN